MLIRKNITYSNRSMMVWSMMKMKTIPTVTIMITSEDANDDDKEKKEF